MTLEIEQNRRNNDVIFQQGEKMILNQSGTKLSDRSKAAIWFRLE